MSVADLDCPECGRLFADFGSLAEHVKVDHSTSPRAARADEVTHYLDEAENEMARIPRSPRNERAPRTQSSTRIPSAQSTAQASDYNPFLKAGDIGRVGKTAALVLTGNMRLTQSQFGDQIIAEVKHRGTLYDWGIKLNSPNHRLMEDLVGTESSRWRGKKIAVTVRENLGRDYIAIDRPAQASTARKAPARKSKRAKR